MNNLTTKELIGVLYDLVNRLCWKIDVLAAVEFLDTKRLLEYELELLSEIEVSMKREGIERWQNG
ncbi:MAG: hypothetical protein IJX16_04830 [Clostridia bacterium]|nr:hypothetical protein [Clostridia bacterium]